MAEPPSHLAREIHWRMSAAGLNPKSLSLRAGLNETFVRDILKGRTRYPRSDTLAKLAAALGCSPVDLLPPDLGRQAHHGGPRSIALEIAIASAFSENRPESFDLAGDAVIVPAPRELGDTTQYFAARVADDSLDAVYPPGATLLIRRLASAGTLKIGDLVVARCFDASGETFEVLAGALGYSRTGEIVLSTKSHNPEIPAAVLVQPPAGGDGLGERALRYVPRDRKVEYAPRPGDPAEIIGLIEKALPPQRKPRQ